MTETSEFEWNMSFDGVLFLVICHVLCADLGKCHYLCECQLM